MTDAARQLGEDLARALSTSSSSGTVSAEVVDVTDAGTVNVMMGGALVTDVACADSYRNRRAGDWVAVRPGGRPVVMWRLGDDPGPADAVTIRQLATEVALDEQVVRAATWGTAAPSGSDWQQVNTLYLRKNTEGKVELYGQLGSESDPSPDAPAGRAPKPVTVTASSSGSWRNGRRDDYRDYPFQGDYTGGGNLRGAWFYGTKIADACSGKTVAKMTVSFTRRRGSGANAKRPMHLYLHDHTSPPSSLDLDEGPEELLSLSVGAMGTATIPADWRAKLASGSRKGLAIYAKGSRDYASFSGGSITITFS
ncbi:hypothetical protein [Streptomyces caniferus]|uniref:hypothetical protein n=1 Tax=Streptomyces caniferus TaxID=285557 RepID=UPI00382BC97B